MHVRPLHIADASAFQALRLFGLRESPSAFGSSYEEECERPLERVRDHLTGSEDRVFFGAFLQSRLVGVVGVGREQGVKQRHIAFVRSLFVAPDCRGQGLGKELLDAALGQAHRWPGIEQVTLAVTAGNEAAIQLYRSAGFSEVGRMPRALRIGCEYFDEVNMVRFIEAP